MFKKQQSSLKLVIPKGWVKLRLRHYRQQESFEECLVSY